MDGRGQRGGRIGVAAALTFLRVAVLALAALAVVPGLLPGWQSHVIVSGSMEPAIKPGDVVVAAPATDLDVGAVVVFRDPLRPGRRVTHRIAEVRPDGALVTKGDANQSADSSRVPRDHLEGAGRLLVPAIGLPAVWAREGDVAPLALSALVAAGLVGSLVARSSRRPRRRLPSAAAAGSRSAPAPARAACLVLVALVCVGGSADRSEAAFTSSQVRPGNTFSSGTFICSAPGSTTLTAVADTDVVESNPNTNRGTQQDWRVRSRNNNGDIEGLVRFAIPPAPAGCEVTGAVLRPFVKTVTANRTLRVGRASRSWVETTVTWNTRPAITGTPVTVATGTFSANAYATVDVTALVRAGPTASSWPTPSPTPPPRATSSSPPARTPPSTSPRAWS